MFSPPLILSICALIDFSCAWSSGKGGHATRTLIAESPRRRSKRRMPIVSIFWVGCCCCDGFRSISAAAAFFSVAVSPTTLLKLMLPLTVSAAPVVRQRKTDCFLKCEIAFWAAKILWGEEGGRWDMSSQSRVYDDATKRAVFFFKSGHCLCARVGV